MGGNLALQAIERGLGVVGFSLGGVPQSLLAAGVAPADSLAAFAGQLRRPRKISLHPIGRSGRSAHRRADSSPGGGRHHRGRRKLVLGRLDQPLQEGPADRDPFRRSRDERRPARRSQWRMLHGRRRAACRAAAGTDPPETERGGRLHVRRTAGRGPLHEARPQRHRVRDARGHRRGRHHALAPQGQARPRSHPPMLAKRLGHPIVAHRPAGGGVSRRPRLRARLVVRRRHGRGELARRRRDAHRGARPRHGTVHHAALAVARSGQRVGSGDRDDAPRIRRPRLRPERGGPRRALRDACSGVTRPPTKRSLRADR